VPSAVYVVTSMSHENNPHNYKPKRTVNAAKFEKASDIRWTKSTHESHFWADWRTWTLNSLRKPKGKLPISLSSNNDIFTVTAQNLRA
jgi:hypothetical protein